MATSKEMQRRLSLLEVYAAGTTHYRWVDGTTEAEYRKSNNIPDSDEVMTIGWIDE